MKRTILTFLIILTVSALVFAEESIMSAALENVLNLPV